MSGFSSSLTSKPEKSLAGKIARRIDGSRASSPDSTETAELATLTVVGRCTAGVSAAASDVEGQRKATITAS